ncbi:MAG: flagella basal body P-ring formation protein FlgA [Terriglobales bacterium]
MPRNFAGFLLTVLLGINFPAAGQTHQDRVAISTQRVANAMAQAGWKVGAGQIKLLSQVTSTAQDAWLEVVQVTHWQGDKLKAELRCHDPRACLPFYILVNEAGTADKSGQTLPLATAQKHPEDEITPEQPLLRSGDPATMMFSDPGISITMPVICLQSGHRGQMIRVASTDHKRFYKAQIVGPGLLRATTL